MSCLSWILRNYLWNRFYPIYPSRKLKNTPFWLFTILPLCLWSRLKTLPFFFWGEGVEVRHKANLQKHVKFIFSLSFVFLFSFPSFISINISFILFWNKSLHEPLIQCITLCHILVPYLAVYPRFFSLLLNGNFKHIKVSIKGSVLQNIMKCWYVKS